MGYGSVNFFNLKTLVTARSARICLIQTKHWLLILQTVRVCLHMAGKSSPVWFRGQQETVSPGMEVRRGLNCGSGVMSSESRNG